MSGDSTDDDITSYRISRPTPLRRTRPAFFICLLLPFLFATPGTAQIQSLKPIDPASALPDAPSSQIEFLSSGQQPCPVTSRTQSAGAVLVSTAGRLTVQVAGFAPVDSDNQPPQPARAEPSSCPPSTINPFSRFISEPHAPPLTPRQKGELAIPISSTPLTPSPSLEPPPFPSAPIRTRRTAPA